MRLAMCLMMRNEKPYLAEWLAFHNLQGVSHFRIYDNESDDGSSELVDQLSSHFDIERIVWRESGIFRQQSAFDDCARALAGQYDWVAFLDADEFLFDPAFRPLPLVLSHFPAEVGAVAVNQRVFGSAGLTEIDDAALVIRRFTRRGRDDYPEHAWVKTIARPERVAGFRMSHATALTEGIYALADGGRFETQGQHAGHATRIAKGGLRLHHYILKSLGEYRRKQRRGAVSDRPDEGYLRLNDAYFTRRDQNINAHADETLLALASLVEARRDLALSAAAGPAAAMLPPVGMPANRKVKAQDLPDRTGFLKPDGYGMIWLESGEESGFAFTTDARVGRLRMSGYLIAADFPVAEMAVRVNGTLRPLTNIHLDGRSFTAITEPMPIRPGRNRVGISLPYFLPVRFTNRNSRDPRYLGVALTEAMIVA